MTYYVGNMPAGEHLAHYGTKGMRWGQRRYQNPDGSLTAAGQARYNRYTSGANRARTMASMNRAAAGRSKSRLARSIYGINDRYYTRRANRLTAKANRVKTGKVANANPNRSRNIRRAAAIAGGVALGAGAAYLGYRHRGQIKGLAKSAGNAFKNFNGAKNAFAGVRKPGSRTAKTVNGHYKQVFRNGMSKLKRDPNVKVLKTELSTKTRQQSKEAFKKFAGKAKKVGKKASKVGKAALEFGGNNHVIGATANAATGTAYYAHARKRGASKKQALAIGATRAATGRILPAHAVGYGVRVYNNRKKKRSRK